MKIDYSFSEILILIKLFYNIDEKTGYFKVELADKIEMPQTNPILTLVLYNLIEDGVLVEHSRKGKRILYKLNKDELEKCIFNQINLKQLYKFYEDTHAVVI